MPKIPKLFDFFFHWTENTTFHIHLVFLNFSGRQNFADDSDYYFRKTAEFYKQLNIKFCDEWNARQLQKW